MFQNIQLPSLMGISLKKIINGLYIFTSVFNTGIIIFRLIHCFIMFEVNLPPFKILRIHCLDKKYV